MRDENPKEMLEWIEDGGALNWNGAGGRQDRERKREKLVVVTNPIRCAGAAEEPLFSNTKMEGSRATSQKVKKEETGNGSAVDYGE